MTEVALLLLAMVLVAACGAFVAAEFALVTVPRSTVEREAASGDRKSQGVLTSLRALSTQLSGAQLGITVTNLGIGFLAEPAIASLVGPGLENAGLSASAASSVALTIALVLATSITMIFGELVPKNLAIAAPLATARAVAGFQRGFTKATAWPIRFFNGTANAILRRLGIEPQEELASARSAEELSALVRHSANSGTLAEDTAELVERSLAFGDRRARDAMTPRSQMVSLRPEDTLDMLITTAKESGHSRFPVIEVIQENGHTEIDVLGLAHVRGALAVPFEQRAHTTVATVVTDATLVPDSLELDELLDDLRAGGLQMALLIDEFGSLAGLVTLEDLVEEIVGEVRDEHDTDEFVPAAGADGSWHLPGLMRVDEASERLGVELPEDEAYDTLGGLVADELGRLAAVGDSIELISAQVPGEDRQRLRLDVLDLDGHRVESVRIAVLGPVEPEDDEHAPSTHRTDNASEREEHR
jgi:CBS domain containing-hemolysin-like protein